MKKILGLLTVLVLSGCGITIKDVAEYTKPFIPAIKDSIKKGCEKLKTKADQEDCIKGTTLGAELLKKYADKVTAK